jgi:hypothetical protein
MTKLNESLHARIQNRRGCVQHVSPSEEWTPKEVIGDSATFTPYPGQDEVFPPGDFTVRHVTDAWGHRNPRLLTVRKGHLPINGRNDIFNCGLPGE